MKILPENEKWNAVNESSVWSRCEWLKQRQCLQINKIENEQQQSNENKSKVKYHHDLRI